MVYRVPIPLYLEMIDGLGSAQRFGLSNQTLDNGFVVFNGAGGRKRLQTILDWFNDSKPPSGVYLKTYTVKVGEFTLEGLQKHVEALRGPDDDGFYHGRCPSCKAGVGGRKDSDKDHFYANPTDGRIGCFAGCKKKEVLAFFKETHVSSEETVQTTLPTQTLSVSTQNTELVSIPDDWKSACAFVYSLHYEAKRNQNQFYLGKAAQGWDTLGGKREGDETPEECMIREVQEELGVVNVENIEYIGYDSFSKSVLYKVTTNDWPEIHTHGTNERNDSVKEVRFFGVNDAKNANLSFRGRQHLKMLIKDAQVVSTERSDGTKDKLQTKAVILEQNVDYLVVQKLKKTGEPGTSHKIMIEELQTFASSFESFKKGQRITIQEHYDALGWDLVEDQGTRAITRRYHPYIAALYALGEIDVYKDGSIERRV